MRGLTEALAMGWSGADRFASYLRGRIRQTGRKKTRWPQVTAWPRVGRWCHSSWETTIERWARWRGKWDFLLWHFSWIWPFQVKMTRVDFTSLGSTWQNKAWYLLGLGPRRHSFPISHTSREGEGFLLPHPEEKGQEEHSQLLPIPLLLPESPLSFMSVCSSMEHFLSSSVWHVSRAGCLFGGDTVHASPMTADLKPCSQMDFINNMADSGPIALCPALFTSGPELWSRVYLFTGDVITKYDTDWVV